MECTTIDSDCILKQSYSMGRRSQNDGPVQHTLVRVLCSLDPRKNPTTPFRGETTTPSSYTERNTLQDELFPFHSPLLRESWLFSVPALIDMLKFSA